MSGTTEGPIGQEMGLLSVPAVAKFLSLSRSKVYGMMDAGELPYVKIGRSRRVRWCDVIMLVERNTISRDRTAGAI